MVRVEVYEGSTKIAEVGLPEKKFATGSVGYWASQKLEINRETIPVPVPDG